MRTKIKMRNRILSLALTFVMVFGMMPMSSFTAFAAEDATATITGLKVAVDDKTYESGTVTLTPESGDVTIIVTGTNLQNADENNILIFYDFDQPVFIKVQWADVNAEGTEAKVYFESSTFKSGTEIQYSNDNGTTIIDSEIYFNYVCDHSGSTHTTATDNYDGTHSFTCTVCEGTVREECDYQYEEGGISIKETCANGCDHGASLRITVPYGDDAVYTGNPIPVEVCADPNFKGSYTLTYDTYDGVTPPTNVDRWRYTLTVSDVTIEDFYEITAVTPTVSVSAIDNLTYTGEAQALVNAGETNFGTMMYRLGIDDELTENIPTATNAGTYQVYYYAKGDGENINDSDLESMEVIIAKATPTVSAAPTVADRTFDPHVILQNSDLTGGTVLDVNGNTLEGTWSWKEQSIVPTVNNAGYEAVFTPADTNYDAVTATIEVNVARATPDIGTVSANPSELQNTLDIDEVVLSRTNTTIYGTLEFTDGELQYGEHTYNWKFTPGSENYETITGTVEITVNDTIDPTATYKIGTDVWKQFVNTISFGLFCKDYKTVEIEYSDGENGSGIATKQYYISNEEITDTSNVEWKDYTGTIYLNPTGTYFVYVKVADAYGNSVILNSEGIVIYADSTISPEAINYGYKESATRTVEIAMNGNTFVKLTDGDDEVIAADNYTMDTTTGELTLKETYLDTLDVGTYTYQIYMNPQGVETEEVTLAYEFTVNVTAKELTVTGATADSRAYDGTKTVKITGVTLSGIESSDAVAVDLTGLQGTLSSANAGNYTSVTLPELTLTGADAGNYTLVQPTGAVATSVKISKADAEITVGQTEYNKTFGDADFTLDVTDDNPEADVTYSLNVEDVITISNGTATIKGAGTATITVSLAESANYNAGDDKTITVTVAKATYSVNEINKSYLYSRENADSINLAELLPADCGKVSFEIGFIPFGAIIKSFSVTDDGILSYTVASGDIGTEEYGTVYVETQNYASVTIKVNVKLIDQIPVSPKEGTEVTLKNNTLTYGEALSKLEFNSVVFVGTDGKEVAGTLAWKDADATPNAGTTTATWVFTPSNEEYASLEGTVAITVNKATPTVSAVPTVADRVYNPSVILQNSDLTGGTISVPGTWSWQTANIIPRVDNSGYVAVFTPSDITNYETVTRTITVNVAKATPHIETVPSAADITYGATLGSSALSGGVVQYSDTDNTVVAGSFAWKDASTKPAVSDSNSTAYTVVFTPADTTNYNTVETTITLTVNKAENAPNMPGNTMSAPYSNKTVGAVTLPDGWAWQDADKNTALEVGVSVEATAVYTGTDKGNYENESVVITITRSACEHTNTEVRDAKKATCEETGYTGDTYCKDCGECTATGTEIPLADHKGGTATCTKKAVCSVCGKEYGSVDSSKHGETEIKGYVAATCTAGGYTGDTYCKDCGVKLASGQTTDKLGHDYRSEVTKEPTTTEEGEMTYTCLVCSHTYTQPIEKITDDGSDNNEDSKPDTGKPFIKDDKGKEGWDVIRDEVETAKDGDTIIVDMYGTTVVPGDVFDDIKGRDVTIVFDMGNEITWSVNGKDITSDHVSDIDFGIKVGAEANNAIPVDVINKVTGERYSMNISLSYDGEFGFKAVLSLNMETKNAGLFAMLYYYNEQSGALEFICEDEIAADGTAELTFTHASEYTIVIDEKQMTTLPDAGDTTSPDTGNVPNSPKTGDGVSIFLWMTAIGFGIVTAFTGLKLKKKNKN